jgi:hypothetical protein
MVDPDYIPLANNPLGKTVRQLIQDDVISGTNKTGYREFIPVLLKENVILSSEAQIWRTALPMKEKPLPDLSALSP